MAKMLNYVAFPPAAIAENATTPNPGVVGVQVWSTSALKILVWTGAKWVVNSIDYLDAVEVGAGLERLGFSPSDEMPYAAEPAPITRLIRSWQAVADTTVPILRGHSGAVYGTGVVSANACAIAANAYQPLSRLTFATLSDANSHTGLNDQARTCGANFDSSPISPQGGGFFFRCRYAVPAVSGFTSDSRLHIGMITAGSVWSASDPSSIGGRFAHPASIGFSWDAADTLLSFIVPPASGYTAIKTALSGPSIAKVDVSYAADLAIRHVKGSATIRFGYRKVTDWKSVPAWTYQTVDLPPGLIVTGTMLRPHAWLSNGPTGGVAAAIDLCHLYLESEL